jgi:hypothetical protein
VIALDKLQKQRPKDPANMKEAELDPEFKEFWLPGLLKEYAKHEARESYEFMLRSEVPHRAKIYDHRMVFVRKYSEPDREHPLGEVITPGKVRMTIAAYAKTMKEGFDYSQRYAPTVRDTSIKVLLAIAAHEDLELCKIDIETFFLWGDLKDAKSKPLFMEIPPYFPIPPARENQDLVLCLKKSIYGCPQAAYCAHVKLLNCLLAGGKVRRLDFVDSCVFILTDKKDKAIFVCHVDDLLIAATLKALEMVEKLIAKEFKYTKVMNPASYLSLQIERDRPRRWLKIHQGKYILEKLAEFQMDKTNPAKIPLDPSVRNVIIAVEGEKIPPDKEKYQLVIAERTPTIKKEYQRIVGSLMFLKTREDLGFAVNFLARHLQDPSSQHLTWARHVLRYLAGTIYNGTVFQSKSPLVLHGWFDADLAGDVSSGRSTIGVTIRLGGCGTILFYSRLGKKPADSTAMAETYAGVSAAKDVVWLKTLLNELGYPQDEATVLRGDNQVMIDQCSKNLNHYDSRHYRIAQAMLYQLVSEKAINFVKCPSSENHADPLSKPLPLNAFEAHVKTNMGPQQS